MLDRFEKFSFCISEINRSLHKIAGEEMEEYGLKGPYAVYFTTMYRFKEGITATKLCELCSKDKSDVSRAINLFIDKGIVTREANNENSYRALLKLTDSGIKLAKQITEKANKAVQFVGKDLGVSNRKIFYDCLESITTNLNKLSEEGIGA